MITLENIVTSPLQKFIQKAIQIALLLYLLISGSLLSAHAQSDKQSDKATMIKALVDSQNYVFVAQTAMPMTGRVRNLTSQYDLKVTQTSIVSYLPYFGRAEVAPMDPTQGGIQFTSKSFDYKMTARKKDGWYIEIKPKDNRDVRNLNLTITSDGYASLQVNSNTRQSISFNGYVTAPTRK